MTIQVLETHRGSPDGFRFATRPAPTPGPGEVLIDVWHTCLNFGETRRGVRGLEADGTVLGWDASGVIAAVGPGTQAPPVGTPVVTRAALGGWAQQRVAHVEDIAVVPPGVDLAEAASLPTAAGTALGALWRGGPLLGRTVLVTGASGGVGRFAVQLAHIGGARVIAAVGSAQSAAGLQALGADLVVTDLGQVQEGVDLVLEGVGGAQLVQAFGLLRYRGVLQSYGWASGEDAVFPQLATVGPTERRLEGFVSSENRYGALLQPLLALLRDGRLKTEIKWRGDWRDYGAAMSGLLGRQLRGKAVLDVSR